MSIVDKALEANRNFAKSYDPKLGKPPATTIAVVTCMDPRLSDLPAILGLPQADIDVIRTGGPAVTEDVLGELVVSTRVIGSKEIMLLNHTGCGFTNFTDDELNAKLAASTGNASPAPMRFFPVRILSKTHGNRSGCSDRIPGSRRMSQCEALFSTWRRVSSRKSSLLQHTPPPEGRRPSEIDFQTHHDGIAAQAKGE